MTNNEKALELVQKCLDDWPYAATRVIDIMKRLEHVQALLKEQEAQPVKVDTRKTLDGETDDGPIYIMDTFYRCPSCGSVFSRTHKNYDIRYCEHCGQAVKWE